MISSREGGSWIFKQSKGKSAINSSLIFTLIWLLSLFLGLERQGHWQFKSGSNKAQALAVNERGEVEAQLEFPGSYLIYQEWNRKTLRPDPTEFRAGYFSIEVKVSSETGEPVKGNLFIKDKDGYWFQSQQDLYLKPGEWQTVQVSLDGFANELAPVGHLQAWNSHNAVNIHTRGLQVYGRDPRTFRISCRNNRLSGTRPVAPLAIFNWEMPTTGEQHELIRGRFTLSREYFNPFDAEEIRVDLEAEGPAGAPIVWPAFYSQNYVRTLHYDRELLIPTGRPEWAYRFTPDQAGDYRFRIRIEDRSGPEKEILLSPWQRVAVGKSDRPGFIRVSDRDHHYFEFSTGEFFFPIGFNLHTPRDLRAEKQLQLGYLPDRGTFSYDEYFQAMQTHGLNATEIWMAAWSGALEWSSRQRNYYGLGRYNLANAWKLDHILESARRHGIYVQLVLDNHGKLSGSCDAEWEFSPHNLANAFALADGACLNVPRDFFTSASAWRHYRNRNRYVAGRWGAYPHLFGVELWSEINLVTEHDLAYKDGSSLEWHRNAARHFRELDPGRHLITTHFCDDYNLLVRHQKLYELPEIEYVVGDAYRVGSREKIPFVDHMLQHEQALAFFKKPVLITEYGGTPYAGDRARIEADLHAGLWCALFTQQAGAPFLWWHDFVHRGNQYPHYAGLAKFMQGLDPRGKNFCYRRISVQDGRGPAGRREESEAALFAPNSFHAFERTELITPEILLRKLSQGKAVLADDYMDPSAPPLRQIMGSEVNPELGAFIAGNERELYGWIFDQAAMYRYPEAEEKLTAHVRQKLVLSEPPLRGKYRLCFYQTISGELVEEKILDLRTIPVVLDLPPFKIDLAFKLLAVGGSSEENADETGK